MRPIPKAMLIHSADIQEVEEKDQWGSESLSDPTVLQRVRIEPSTKYVRTKDNNEIQLAATMFFDCFNSRPRGQVFYDGQVITFNDERYRVKLVELLYDGRRLHHYEIGMVRDA